MNRLPTQPDRFDVIGDIHGCHASLTALLETLGYQVADGVYRHPSRRVIFLGDFIDRGPHQREVIETVRPMVEAGAALSVMGNHEFNALAFGNQGADGNPLRPHSEKNQNQHAEFLAAYPLGSQEYDDVLGWFWTLPLWLDLGDLRIVHACWDGAAMERLGVLLDSEVMLTPEALVQASIKDSQAYADAELLLKGKEISLPAGSTFRDKDGHVRDAIRVRWWDAGARTYRDAFLGPDNAKEDIPDERLPNADVVSYPESAPPVFVGHYWQTEVVY